MDPKFKQNIILFAEVIVPDLRQKTSLEYSFIKNFKKLFLGLEKDSASKIKLLVRLVETLSLVYNLKSFEKLSYNKRQKFIDKLYQFPIGKIVAGLTGLRSLVLISYYGIDEVWPTIKYDGPIKSQTS
ncbi:MAG: hypothetical protein KAH72_11485 [Flavobacteriaceae bacterium]|nr:hypothetical protein [Flavobacteriaceae bacterium]